MKTAAIQPVGVVSTVTTVPFSLVMVFSREVACQGAGCERELGRQEPSGSARSDPQLVDRLGPRASFTLSQEHDGVMRGEVERRGQTLIEEGDLQHVLQRQAASLRLGQDERFPGRPLF